MRYLPASTPHARDFGLAIGRMSRRLGSVDGVRVMTSREALVPKALPKSMVIIGAGLAALNREVLEAARMDGASELQTFRYVTFPLLRPVLIVVFITMIINVLKIFDIILSLVPESSQQQTNVIALEMWRVGFTGFGNKGLASAIAVFLFILVIPVIAINIRRIRE